jgi:hypothetical protein
MPEISQYEFEKLQDRVKRQQNVIERKAGELKAAEARATKAEADRLKAEADVQRMTDENPYRAENEKLKGHIRDSKHRAAFAKVAAEKGATPDVIESIWKLVGYEARGDEPDPAVIGAMLDEAKGKPGIDRLFAPPAQPNGSPLPKPGIGNGQGGRLDVPSSYTMGTHNEDGRMQDAAWQYRNFDQIAAAAQARIDRGEI